MATLIVESSGSFGFDDAIYKGPGRYTIKGSRTPAVIEAVKRARADGIDWVFVQADREEPEHQEEDPAPVLEAAPEPPVGLTTDVLGHVEEELEEGPMEKGAFAGTYPCRDPQCDREFKSTRGRKAHESAMHPTLGMETPEPLPTEPARDKAHEDAE